MNTKLTLLCIIAFTISSISSWGQSFSPSQGEIDVSVSPTLTITFDEGSTVTLGSNLYIYVSNGDWSEYYAMNTGRTAPPIARDSRLNVSGNVLTIDLSGDVLSESTEFFVYADAGAILVDGTAWDSLNDDSYTYWTFTTGSEIIPTFFPDLGAIDVSTSPTLTITFDEGSTVTLGSNLYIYVSNGDWSEYYAMNTGRTAPPIARDSRLNVSGNVLTIDLSGDALSESTEFFVYADAGAILVDGTAWDSLNDDSYTYWTFTTAAATPVTVSTFSPTLGSNVGISDDIVLTFSEDIELPTTGTPYYISIYSDDDVLFQQFIIYATGIYEGSGSTGSATISGSTLTITHDTDFTNNITYYVTIDAGAFVGSTNGGDFVGLVDGTPPDYYFTASIPPITTFTPTNGTTGVSIATTIEASYSIPIQLTDGTEITDSNVANIITLLEGTTPVAFTATINSNKDLITITPDSYLSNTATINLTIAAVEGSNEQEQTEDQTLTFYTGNYAVWTGATNDIFEVTTNWSRTFSSGYNIIVENSDNDPVVSSDINVNNVTVEPGVTVTIAEGATVTLTGTLELQSSNDASTGNACLLNEGTLNNNGGTMVAYQSISSNSVSYYVSSPNTSSVASEIGGDVGIYEYNTSTDSWAAASGTLSVGTGYVTRSSGAELTFTGDFNNNSTYDLNMVRSTSNYGWNLLGNPYPCSINWESLTLTNMKNLFQIYLNDTQQYGTYNDGVTTNLNSTYPTYIPSTTAIWVQVSLDQASGTVSIPSSARVAPNFTYLKSTTPYYDALIKLSGVSNNIKDELAIVFKENATDDYDDYDSEKRFGPENHAYFELYSINDSKDLTIDSYNTESANSINIDLGYTCYHEDDYTIELSSLVDDGYLGEIELQDLYDGISTTLESGSSYTFHSESGNITDRFILSISNGITTNINNNKDENFNLNIYNSHQTIFIDASFIEDASYTIYDISGRLLENGKLEEKTLNQIETNYKGIMIIKVNHSNGVKNQKLDLF